VRAAVVGRNACPFKPSTFSELLVDEMFTLFHVYQLVQYVLWYWNSYLFVGAIMTIVVLLSAGFSMLLVARAQRAIASVANVTTEVEVCRDGEWVILDSTALVPGDMVRVRPGDVAPCDLAVVAGTCVVDESALTGESMPTLKTPCPRNAAVYDCAHPVPRYTLFAGTTVRQATGGAGGGGKGNGSASDGSAFNSNGGAAKGAAEAATDAAICDEDVVEAAVVATGMDTSKGDLLAVILFPSTMVFKYDEEMPVVISLLMLYAIACFILSIHFQNNSGVSSTWVTKWIYCTSVVNQILSPLLPVALEVGQIQVRRWCVWDGVWAVESKSGHARGWAPGPSSGNLTRPISGVCIPSCPF
jgi:magnesium-transporting ATPase (P-type)